MLISIASLCGGTGKTTVGTNLCELLGASGELEDGVVFIRSNSVIKDSGSYLKSARLSISAVAWEGIAEDDR